LPAAIGRYRPTARLGAGAMGTVYQAHDPLIDRMVAVKVVRTEALDPVTEAQFVERFRQEVQAAGRCSHPAIVGVYDFLEAAGSPAIVMELVQGRSLQQILSEPAARAALPVVPVVLQVLDALGYAHGQGVIHRDIKPANVLLTPAGQAKITDFGIARLNQASVTHTGAMLGTPHYMAPEQAFDGPIDRRADLFSVGAILYEIIGGRPPFAGRSIAETIRRLTDDQEADPGPLAAMPELAPIVRRALAKDPAQRFQTADAFAAALQGIIGSEQPTVVLSDVGRRKTARTWDPTLLQRLERQYAVYVGPLARKTVAHAAQDAASTEELYAILARGLSNPAERSAFLRSLGGARVEPSLTHTRFPTATRTQASAVRPVTGTSRGQAASGVSQAGAGRAPSPSVTTIPAQALAAAQGALAFFVGPIARVLVRDAAAQATSGRNFIDRLCAHVPSPQEADALRRRLRADVEPRLPGA
ncbi:MAG: serine/threonine-protein kinase, partial [Acetobacteraceae bacterium]